MEITVIGEAGYDQAVYGFSLSYKDRAIPRYLWWPCTVEDKEKFSRLARHEGDKTMQRINHYHGVVKNQAGRGGGHDKFLRHIMVWIDIEAPRYWWSEADTYVGKPEDPCPKSQQSESTMHTLMTRDLTKEDFEDPYLYRQYEIDSWNEAKNNGIFNIRDLKAKLPEGYLQRREVVVNYEILTNMINQRKNHRLPEWKKFIDAIYKQVDYPGLLPERT